MDEIKYPKKETEAEIQSRLWFLLRDRGLDARLEVYGFLGSRRCKFDIVVFKDSIPQAIIECKSWTKQYSEERIYQLSKNTKQLSKYNRYGLPVFICGRAEAIEDIVMSVLSSVRNSTFEHI